MSEKEDEIAGGKATGNTEREKGDVRQAPWNWGFMVESEERAHTSKCKLKCVWLVDSREPAHAAQGELDRDKCSDMPSWPFTLLRLNYFLEAPICIWSQRH